MMVTTGAMVSCTVTVKLPGAALPCASVAEQFTLVWPSGNVLPDAGLQSGVMLPSTVSVAVAVKETGAPFGPAASTLMSAGSVSTGDLVSRTVTVKLPTLDVLPFASVAVQCTVVSPSGNMLPESASQLTGSVPSTMSVAV